MDKSAAGIFNKCDLKKLAINALKYVVAPLTIDALTRLTTGGYLNPIWIPFIGMVIDAIHRWINDNTKPLAC